MPIVNGDVDFIHPFLSFQSEETISYRLVDELSEKFQIPGDEIRSAVHAAWEELASCRQDMRKKGEETIQFLKGNRQPGHRLAGRPYHIDPEVNHGIPELINSYNIAVLTEDSISHLNPGRRTAFETSWTSGCTTRACYAAANYVKTTKIWI